jgi:hypothetical protein
MPLLNRPYSRPGLAIGIGRRRRASIRRNADVQAPMASASDRIAAADVTFLFLSCRQPKTASARSESSQVMNRAIDFCSQRGVISPPSLSCSPEPSRGKRVEYASRYLSPEPVL